MHLLLCATFLLLGVEKIQAQEALLLLGGHYLDGYMDNEVEVWSHSSECNLDIPSTPDSFVTKPGVALFQEHVYVCGGDRIGTTHTHDTCDKYSLKDNVWTQGLSLKSNSTNVYLTTAGTSLLAAYRNEDENLVVSTLDSEESGWIETFPLDGPFPQPFFSFAALDDKHVAISATYNYYPFEEKIHVLEVETGEVATMTIDWSCNYPVMYNNNLTCVRTVEQQRVEILALTDVEEGFTNPTWSVIETPPLEFFAGEFGPQILPMVVLDGMLTFVDIHIARLYYWEGEEWKSGEIDFPKQDTSFLVIPCNL